MGDGNSGEFSAWLAHFRQVVALPPGERSDAAWINGLARMSEEAPSLVVYRENCVDGCCPGDLVLARLEHPTVPPEWLVSYFRELITDEVRKEVGVITPTGEMEESE